MISLKQKHKGFFERKKRTLLFDKLFTLGIYTQNNAKKELLKS